MAKILVIDNENQICELLAKMLKRDGHQVFMAQDGEIGVQNFYYLQPDLVITDIVMPNKNGFEVIADLITYNPEQPIIAMSGGRRTTIGSYDKKSADMSGIKGILQKPFTHQQLRDVIQVALN
ncbi:MAG: hypothetical protein RL755_198 [Pseudomonadota bacterium]|jgi:DNA-binding response OmpR family regulator